MDAYASKVTYPGSRKTFKANSNYQRDNYSLYASYDWHLTDKSNLIFNARQTWACGSDGSQTNLDKNITTNVSAQNMNKFTPEIQYVLNLTEDSSFYAKAGKSFRLPNLTQIFGTGNINPGLDLRPEQGTHYEVGYKANIGKGNLRFALFNFKIKDSIDADVKYDNAGTIEEVNYFNEDVKNTGVELEYLKKLSDKWDYNISATYQNPKSYDDDTHKWAQESARMQLNAGVDYTLNKFSANLNCLVLADREPSSYKYGGNSGYDHDLKNRFLVNAAFTYRPTENQSAVLNLRNILDRTEPVSTYEYYDLPFNWTLTYNFSF